MKNTDTLFRPFSNGSLKLSNRIVMAPMTRSFSPDGIPTEAVAEYYRRRAHGGVGLIITEGVGIEHPGAVGYANVPHIYGEKALEGWKAVVEAVHNEGSSIVPQLWHVGSVRPKGMGPEPDAPAYGPSAIRHPGADEKGDLPVEMSENDIENVIEAFAQAAVNAKKTGFDGIEVHGAHGYLVDQFLWSKTNVREDSWGGSLSKRTRFATEIVRAIRSAVGPEYPIIFRFSQWKMGDYRARLAPSPEDLQQLLDPLSDAGVDIFHASTRKYWRPEFKGSDLNLAGWTRKITGKPAITVGSVGLDSDFLGAFMGKDAAPADINNLLDRLTRGEFDLVAIGRALIADPGWPAKIRNGNVNEIIHFTPEALKTLD